MSSRPRCSKKAVDYSATATSAYPGRVGKTNNKRGNNQFSKDPLKNARKSRKRKSWDDKNRKQEVFGGPGLDRWKQQRRAWL